MKKIFIADDDPSIVEVIKIVLKDGGYNVVSTTSGRDVEKEIMKCRPDLILLDIWMSGFDGREITKKLKLNDQTRDIPIIVISALSDTRQIAKEIHAEGFLEKPFDIYTLLKKVKEYAK